MGEGVGVGTAPEAFPTGSALGSPLLAPSLRARPAGLIWPRTANGQRLRTSKAVPPNPPRPLRGHLGCIYGEGTHFLSPRDLLLSRLAGVQVEPRLPSPSSPSPPPSPHIQVPVPLWPMYWDPGVVFGLRRVTFFSWKSGGQRSEGGRWVGSQDSGAVERVAGG